MNDLPGGTNRIAIPSWLVAIASSYLLSTEIGAAATVGYFGQWLLKAPKNVPDWVPPVAIVAACGLLYVFVMGHPPAHLPPTREWWVGFIMWAMAANGVASASGRTAGAAKTNSL